MIGWIFAAMILAGPLGIFIYHELECRKDEGHL